MTNFEPNSFWHQQHNRPNCSPCLLFPLYPSLLYETLFLATRVHLGTAYLTEIENLFAKNTVDKVKSVRISALKSYCMMLCMILCMTLCITRCMT